MPIPRKKLIRLPFHFWQGSTRYPRRINQGAGVTLQLFLFVFLPLTILLLAVTFGSLSLHHQAMRSLVGDRDLRAVQEASNSLDQALSHQIASIHLMAQMVGSPADLSKLEQPANHTLIDFDQGLALFTPAGQLLAADRSNLTWQTDILADGVNDLQAFLRRAQTDIVYSPAIPRANGGYIVLVAAPTPSGHVLVGAFSPDKVIRNALQGLVGSGQVALWVVSPEKQVIFQTGNLVSRGSLTDHPGTASALQGESGINYLQTDQGEHVVAFSPVAPMGWGLVLEESWEAITSPMLRTTQLAPLVLVPVVLLMLVALWFGLYQIVQPLRELQARAAALAGGNFQSIKESVGGIGEIQSLQEQLADMADKLQEAQENLHSYIGAITAGVENERRSLARELHDDTLQALIALNQRLQMATLNPKQDQKAVDQVQNLVQQTMVNLRRMVRGLRPIYLDDLGLAASLEMLVNETKTNHSLPVHFQQTGEERRLQPEVEMALYRIAQEALSNIARHAKATQGWVQLEYLPEEIHLIIRDNGIGFQPPQTPSDFARNGHYGLLGLYERAELIGARIEVNSKPGIGSIVRVQLDQLTTVQLPITEG